MLDRYAAIDCAPMPNHRVECVSLLGQSFSDHWLRPVTLGHNFVIVFIKLQSCRLCYSRICELVFAVTRFHENGADLHNLNHVCGCSPLKST